METGRFPERLSQQWRSVWEHRKRELLLSVSLLWALVLL